MKSESEVLLLRGVAVLVGLVFVLEVPFSISALVLAGLVGVELINKN